MRFTLSFEVAGSLPNFAIMSTIKDFAKQLAEQELTRISSLSHSDQMTLHRRRILDAKAPAFWKDFVSELRGGIEVFDSELSGKHAYPKTYIQETSKELTVVNSFARHGSVTAIFNSEVPEITISLQPYTLRAVEDDALEAFRNYPNGTTARIGSATDLAKMALDLFVTGIREASQR